MADRLLRDRLNGSTTRNYPEMPKTPAPIPPDPPGDSEELRRFRRFFATHDINGLTRNRAEPGR